MKLVSPYLFMQDSPVNEFVHEIGKDFAGNDCTFVHNDIIVLFNQQRLESFGQMSAQAIIDSFSPTVAPLAELRSKLDDNQLLDLVKSRHIQSKGDLLKYAEKIGADKSLLEQEIISAQSGVDSDSKSDVKVVNSDSKSE